MARAAHLRRGSLVLTAAAIGALAGVGVAFGDGPRLLSLLQRARPGWIAAAIGLQAVAIGAKAALFHAVLARGRAPARFTRLWELSLVGQFASATVPSAGLAGTWLSLRVLRAWGAPARVAVAAVLLDTVTYHAAFALFTLGALVALGPTAEVAAMAAALVGLALGIGGAAAWLSSPRGADAPRARWAWLARVIDELSSADPALVRSPGLVAYGVALRCGGFALDAATLWACLAAIGAPATPTAAAAALTLGTLARTLGVVPSGVGTFEGAVVWALGRFDLGLEPALAAALLFRGVSIWLPLVPGLWFSRRILPGAAARART